MYIRQFFSIRKKCVYTIVVRNENHSNQKHMKLSQIKRPTKFSIETSELQYEFFVPYLYRNPKTKELKDILIAPTLYVQGNNQTDVQLSPEMCSQSIFEGFNGYTYSLGKLNRLAEINLDKLISFLQIYFSLEGSKDILEKIKE